MKLTRIGILSATSGWPLTIIEGLGRWAQSRPDVVLTQRQERLNNLDDLLKWRVDGVLAITPHEGHASPLIEGNVPVVNLSNTVPGLPFPQVLLDDVAVGRMAAEHFLDRGYRRLMYVQAGDKPLGALRLAGFRDRLAEAGIEPTVHNTSGITSSVDDYVAALESWFTELEKPFGLFGMSDLTADEMIRQCRELGLRVPEDVAVLGVDNDPAVCALTYPPLSSVRRPGRAIAFAAGDLLLELISGAPPPAEPMLLPPVEVMVRRSTETVAVEDPDLADVLALIRTRATSGIRVRDVLAEVPVSRRRLERMCKEVLGRTPLQEIHRVQMRAAKRLLADTTLPMEPIAERVGLPDAHALSRRFHRVTGMTPTDYRKQFGST